jgi:hypothetical protein
MVVPRVVSGTLRAKRAPFLTSHVTLEFPFRMLIARLLRLNFAWKLDKLYRAQTNKFAYLVGLKNPIESSYLLLGFDIRIQQQGKIVFSKAARCACYVRYVLAFAERHDQGFS